VLVHFRVAILANLSPYSGNLANFESVWLQIFWFGDLTNFGRYFESIWLKSAWFGEMYDLYICMYLFTYSYVDYYF